MIDSKDNYNEYVERKSLYCPECNMALEYFQSRENKTWLVAHYSRKDLRSTKFCSRGADVMKAPTINLALVIS